MNQLQMIPENLCEVPTNGYIKVPALFWSNLAFLWVGVFILLVVWRLGKDHKRFYVLGMSTILVGIFSSVYHFMHNANYLVWDMVGIAILMSTFAYFTFSRLIKLKIAWWIGLGGVFVGLIVFVSLNLSNMVDFGLSLGIYFFVLVGEWFLINHHKISSEKYKYLIYAVALQILGAVFSVAERYGIGCDPSNHVFQGHAIWHIATAVSMYFMLRYYLSVNDFRK